MDASRGHPMRCHHEGNDLLLWDALVSLPWQSKYTYKYAVVQQEEEGKGGVKVSRGSGGRGHSGEQGGGP